MKSTRALAVELYREVRAEPGNLLLSPYGIWLALAMLQPGARGAARDALSAVLGIDDVGAVARLGRELAARAEPTAFQKPMIERGHQRPEDFGFHLAVANKLWVQTGYPIAPDYGQRLGQVFGVDLATVDFAGAPAAACDAINRWVVDATHGRIGSIVSPGMLSPLVRAILANAIYFKAGWASEFDEDRTAPARFHLLDGATASVPTMKTTDYLAHADDGDLVAIQLPYVQPDVAMVLIAPRAGAFPDVERALTLDRLDAVLAHLQPKLVSLMLPKFRFETSLPLARALGAIGLADALGPNADLSGISSEPGFFVDEVLHRTYIAVDERGTEAAAVTALLLYGAARPPRPIQVAIDRPFFVLIRDIPTGTALFFGRVVDPR